MHSHRLPLSHKLSRQVKVSHTLTHAQALTSTTNYIKFDRVHLCVRERTSEHVCVCVYVCVCVCVRAHLNRIEFSTGVENAGNLEALNIKHIVCVNEQVFSGSP